MIFHLVENGIFVFPAGPAVTLERLSVFEQDTEGPAAHFKRTSGWIKASCLTLQWTQSAFGFAATSTDY